MQVGIVTNCFGVPLAEGASLGELVETAIGRGLTVIELRQGSLGEFEFDEPPVPNADALAELPLRFPEARFNVALAWGYLDTTTDRNDPLVQAAVDAAFAVGGEHPAHLRLVDPFTPLDEVADVETVAACLERIARPLVDLGGILSIENARLPWLDFLDVFNATRERLRSDAATLRMCFDPGNLLVSEEDTDAIDRFDAAAITRSLDAESIAHVHAKQRRAGNWLPAVEAGDVDWDEQFEALGEIGYTGPLLLETAPVPDVWDAFDESLAYLRSLDLD